MIQFEADPVLDADLNLSIEVAATSGARLIFEVRKCVADTDATLKADSATGLLESPEDSVTAAAATVTRTSATVVTVWIAAAVVKLLTVGAYVAELRELTATLTTSLAEGQLNIRRNAGRESV